MWESGLDNIEMRDLDQFIKMEKLLKIWKLRGFLKFCLYWEEIKRLLRPLLIKSMGIEVGLMGSGYLCLLESSADLIIG